MENKGRGKYNQIEAELLDPVTSFTINSDGSVVLIVEMCRLLVLFTARQDL